MMQRLLGTGYELHPLGSRKDNDPLSHIKVSWRKDFLVELCD